MAAPNAHQSTVKLYHSVIEEVVNNVKEAFLDEGVDDVVLHELKQIWENKVLATKALDSLDPTQVRTANSSVDIAHEFPSSSHRVRQVQLDTRIQPKTAKSFEPFHRAVEYNPSTSTRGAPILQGMSSGFFSNEGLSNTPISSLVRSLPQQSVITNVPNGLFMQVPGVHKNSSGQQYTNSIFPNPLTSSMIVSSGRDPGDKRSDMNPLNSSATVPGSNVIVGPTQQLQTLTARVNLNTNQNGSRLAPDSRQADHQQVIVQLDGPVVITDDDIEFNAEGAAEEPSVIHADEGDTLNSEDDEVSNENTDEMFEADDVVVCQFEKVSRISNKWKFILKDGIINLGRKDYVFNKALGEAEF